MFVEMLEDQPDRDDEVAGRLLFLCCMEKEGCWQAGQVIHVASTW